MGLLRLRWLPLLQRWERLGGGKKWTATEEKFGIGGIEGKGEAEGGAKGKSSERTKKCKSEETKKWKERSDEKESKRGTGCKGNKKEGKDKERQKESPTRKKENQIKETSRIQKEGEEGGKTGSEKNWVEKGANPTGSGSA